MRPLNRVKNTNSKESDVAKKFWKDAERAKKVEYIDEVVVFHLTEEESQKCRYEIVDKNNRMAECTVHRDNYSHGIRMFPPHLWEMIDGIAYYRKDTKSLYKRWFPSPQENKVRLAK